MATLYQPVPARPPAAFIRSLVHVRSVLPADGGGNLIGSLLVDEMLHQRQ
jgi:hypothetical protein